MGLLFGRVVVEARILQISSFYSPQFEQNFRWLTSYECFSFSSSFFLSTKSCLILGMAKYFHTLSKSANQDVFGCQFFLF